MEKIGWGGWFGRRMRGWSVLVAALLPGVAGQTNVEGDTAISFGEC